MQSGGERKDEREKTYAAGEAAQKPVSRISVRNLVEFLLRSGDLDQRSGGGMDMEAALLGARIHRKLQKEGGSAYESEVFLRKDTVYEDLIIRVEGRADGVIKGPLPPAPGEETQLRFEAEENDQDSPKEAEADVTIDEIKGMYLDVTALEAPFPVHAAQAKCYAAIYADEYGEETIRIRMTYVNLDSEEIRHFSTVYTASELAGWYADLMDQWHRWAKWELDHVRARNESMQGMDFPFPYREGQQKLTATVYHTIREGKELFLMAPTGVGKTMSCVFPAVRALGEGCGDKIFYLTAKNETLSAGREAFSILDGKGLDFRTVLVTAKEKICPLSEPSCNPEDCPYARGHFDRINDAVFDLLESGHYFGREEILAQAEARKVCPFELTLDTASWCDAILSDYNYVFDPSASLKRFFANGTKGGYIFLIDEAHNLVERGRDMYSAALSKEDVLSAKRTAGKEQKKLARALDRVNRILLEMKHACEEEPTHLCLGQPCRVISFGQADALLKAALLLLAEMQTVYAESEDGALKEKLLDFYFEIRDFTATADYLDESYLIYSEIDRDGGFSVRLFCVNPAARLTDQIDKGRSAVFFSATLLPVGYYRHLLTTRTDPYAVYAPSPFDTKKRLLMIGRDVSTRFRSRGGATYRRIAQYISVTARARTGNYLAFFPSYNLMKEVFRIFREECDGPDVNWILQSPGMREDDREIFLENFYEDPETSLVGFCVMGGMFSEGIDLTGTKLIGAVIVGAGIPQVTNEREILKTFYDNSARGAQDAAGAQTAGPPAFSGSGFDYAYRYPGLNKVEQAAGRVIRTAADTGVILLLDDRLLTPSYNRLFPREWGGFRSCTINSAGEELRAFWADQEM